MERNNFLQNPKAVAIKKVIFELLQNSYGEFDDIISRLTTALITDKDATSFLSLLNKLYELGYLKAINDYKEQLKKLNLNITINSTEINVK